MKSKMEYSDIEEKDDSCLMAHEPAVAYGYAAPPTTVEPRDIPGLPQSWDELQECIIAGEEEYERGEANPMETAIQRMRASQQNQEYCF